MFIEHLRIPVGPGHLHVERVGRGGAPVVLVHGFGTCAFLWRRLAPQLANAGFTVLSLDMLGHGESDRSEDGGYDLAAQADYLDRAITALRIPTAAIVGQDIGAVVALLYAGRRPRQVQRLALLAPSDPFHLPPPHARAVQRSSARVAMGANALFGAMPLMDALIRSGVANTSRLSEPLVARYLAPFVGGDGVEQLLLLARASELPPEDQIAFSAVQSDTLLVRGESDQWSEPEVIQMLAARLTAARTRLVSMPDVGALMAEDAPDALARLLLEWLSAPRARNAEHNEARPVHVPNDEPL